MMMGTGIPPSPFWDLRRITQTIPIAQSLPPMPEDFVRYSPEISQTLSTCNGANHLYQVNQLPSYVYIAMRSFVVVG